MNHTEDSGCAIKSDILCFHLMWKYCRNTITLLIIDILSFYMFASTGLGV